MRVAIVALAAALVVGSIPAQTTGFPGLNDFTINGTASGSTSCIPPFFIGGGPVVFAASGSPTSSAALLLLDPCPCSPGLAFFPNSCHPSLTSSQDIGVCGLVVVPLPMVGVGSYVFTSVTLPPAVRFSAQAVVVDVGCAPSFAFVFTQAYTVFT